MGAPEWPVRPFARTLGTCFICGGTLAALWLLFPAHAERNAPAVAFLAILAVVIGSVLHSRLLDRAPTAVPAGLLVVGQVEIALATWLSGDIRTGIICFFAWIAPLSFRYLRSPAAWGQTVLTGALLVGLVIATRSPQDLAERVGFAGLLAGTCGVVIFLSRRLIAESTAIERRDATRLEVRARQQALVASFGYRALDGVDERTLLNRLVDVARDGLHPGTRVDLIDKGAPDEGQPASPAVLLDLPGGRRPLALAVRADEGSFDGEDRSFLAGLVAVARAALSRAEVERRIRHDARHDTLTGLPNRAMLLEGITTSLAAVHGRGSPVSVMLIDLDDFKTVNDSLGHRTGDRLLEAVAGRLHEALRDDDLLGRLGGDEFVVVADATDVETALAIARRLQRVWSQPIAVDGALLTAVGSIGITVANSDSTAESMLGEADAAMYAAKDAGRGQVAVFDAELRASALQRLRLAEDLRAAVRGDQLGVVYQPIVNLTTGQVEGFEALVRWAHVEWGQVSPERFIPVAEDTGLVHEIDALVLREACRQTVALNGSGGSYVSVNISPRELVVENFPQLVMSTLRETGLRPQRLQLEITEGMLLQPGSVAENTIGQLHLQGVRWALDDFGKGFSWLSHLGRLPLDVLKIDKSFVDHVVADERTGGILTSVVAMAERLGLRVVAEGIEEPAQLEALQGMHCDSGQGYLLGRPGPLTAATIARRLPRPRSVRPAGAGVRGG